MTGATDVLTQGPPPKARDLAPRRQRFGGRWPGFALLAAAAAVAAVVVAVNLVPGFFGGPTTGVRLVVADPAGLAWIEADGGDRTELADSAGADKVVSIGSATLVQYPNDDLIFADSVVSYRPGLAPVRVGEADRVIPGSPAGVWLVVAAGTDVAGGAALTSASGAWRSHIFTLPIDRELVGAVPGGLVSVSGAHRVRKLQVWDPQLNAVVRNLGWAASVLGVQANSVLVSMGCLSKGCTNLIVDATTGVRRVVQLPVGWLASGPPVLAPDGQHIAQVVDNGSGDLRLAWGSPQHMGLVADVRPAAGAEPEIAENGWLALPDVTGDVTLWRDGQQVKVELPPDNTLVGVSLSP